MTEEKSTNDAQPRAAGAGGDRRRGGIGRRDRPRSPRDRVDRGRRDRGLSFGDRARPRRGAHFAQAGRGPALILLHGFPAGLERVAPDHGRGWRGAIPSSRSTCAGSASRPRDRRASTPRRWRPTSTNSSARSSSTGPMSSATISAGWSRMPMPGCSPADLRGAMILDVPVPGLDGWDEAISGPDAWHVGFLQTPDLPETFVAGRHAAFLGHFLAMGKPFRRPDRRSAQGLCVAGAIPRRVRDVPRLPRQCGVREREARAQRCADRLRHRRRLPFAPLADRIVAALKDSGFTNVTRATVPDAVHYLVADNPDALAALIEQHA